MELSVEEKKILLDAARRSINSIFYVEDISEPDYEKFPVLKSKAGAFVTLTEKHRLRGCIGYIISDEPLFRTVCRAAMQAAEHDPRFAPVTKSEMLKLSLEISVLSEPFPMNSYDDIIVGKHGLILEEKGRRGLLLPQVPVEHNLSREQYLDAICQKTGFPSGYWRDKHLKMEMFTATVFSEEDPEVKQ